MSTDAQSTISGLDKENQDSNQINHVEMTDVVSAQSGISTPDTALGARAKRLNQILDRSLAETIRSITYDKMALCFPTLASNKPDILLSAHEQVVSFLQTSCQTEFAKVLKERNAVAKLNDLDEVIEDAKRRKDRGEPAGENPSDLAPDVILRAHLLPRKRGQVAALTAQLQTVQQKNAEALTALEVQRREIDQQTKALKQTIQTFTDAVETSTRMQENIHNDKLLKI